METFLLNEGVPALRYEQGSNDRAIGEFIKSNSSASFDNQLGYVHVYNDGPDVKVHDGQWVLRVAGQFLVVNHTEFVAQFAPDVQLTLQPITTQHGIQDDGAVHGRLNEWIASRLADGRGELTVNTTRDALEVRVTLPR